MRGCRTEGGMRGCAEDEEEEREIDEPLVVQPMKLWEAWQGSREPAV